MMSLALRIRSAVRPPSSALWRRVRGRLLRPGLRRRGQSLVELALILPVLLILVAAAIDLGRLFYGRIAIANAAREGAFEAAQNPASFQAGAVCNTTTNRIMCRVINESNSASVVVAPADVAVVCSPACTATYGTQVTVSVTGHFAFLTPLLGSFFGQDLTFQSSATANYVKIPTAAASTPTPTPTATATSGFCTVPQFVATGSRKNGAQATWNGAGFSSTISFVGGTGNWLIATQSIGVGQVVACTSVITLYETFTPTPTPPPTPTPSPSPTPSPTPACALPVANFTYTQQNKNQPVQFTSTSTPTTGACAITYWRWDYGDGSTDAGNFSITSHSYATQGATYNVTLTVTNPAGVSFIVHPVTTKS